MSWLLNFISEEDFVKHIGKISTINTNYLKRIYAYAKGLETTSLF